MTNLLTYKDEQKYRTFANEVLEVLTNEGYNTFNIDYRLLCDLVSTAKHKNKVNNQLLKNDFTDNIWVHECKDLKDSSMTWIKLRPCKTNTVKKLFIFEVLKSQYATKQMFSKFK